MIKSIYYNCTSKNLIRGYSWTRTNGATGTHSNGGYYTDPYIDVSMYVYKPNGSEQGRSVIPTSSVELLYFIPASYGNYNVKLTRSTSTDKKVWGALAWY